MNRQIIAALLLVAGLGIPVAAVSQRAYIYTDADGNAYAAMDASELPNHENRADNSNFQVDAPLYTYSEDGTTSVPEKDVFGNQIYVKRTYRHFCKNDINSIPTPNRKVSSYFIIAPNDIDADGTPYPGTPIYQTWANANGYLATANSADPKIPQSAVAKGCPMYRGKNGADPLGSWRVPTQREMILICIFLGYYETENTQTGFRSFYRPGWGSAVDYGGYWTATEGSEKEAWYVKSYSPFDFPYATAASGRNADKYNKKRYIRCIRDIQPTN